MSLYLLFYRLLLKTLEIIPYKALFIGGKFLAFIFYLLPNNQRKITLANLKHAFPYKTKEDIDILLRDSLFHSIMTFPILLTFPVGDSFATASMASAAPLLSEWTLITSWPSISAKKVPIVIWEGAIAISIPLSWTKST